MEPSPPTATGPEQEPIFDLALFTKAPARTTPPSTKGFLDLPPEVRLIIYEYVTNQIANYEWENNGFPFFKKRYQPGARVVPNIALALTCRRICIEHLAIAVAAQNRSERDLRTKRFRSRRYNEAYSLDIQLRDNCTGAQVLRILGVDLVDHFSRIEIFADRADGLSMGEKWEREKEGFDDRQLRHQIDLAGGPPAYGWRSESEAFYKRAMLEKAMERADFYLKYEDHDEYHAAMKQRADLFPRLAHPTTWAVEDQQKLHRNGTIDSWKQTMPWRLRYSKQDKLRPPSFEFVNATKRLADGK